MKMLNIFVILLNKTYTMFHIYWARHLWDSSDVDPDCLYPDTDPDRQNLINPYPHPDPVRIQVNKITKLILKDLFKNFSISSINLNLTD